MDYFKRETAVGFTVWDINANKNIYKSRSRHKDAAMVKRAARRKYKRLLDNYLSKHYN